MALLHVSHPPAQTGGGEDILYIYIFFLICPGHPEFWTPLQILIWGPPGCTLFQQECRKSATAQLCPEARELWLRVAPSDRGAGTGGQNLGPRPEQ